MLRIQLDEAKHPEVVKLLEEHLEDMHAWSPPESVHALDLEKLRQPEISFWTIWDGDALLGTGALKTLDSSHGEVKTMRTPKAARGRGAAKQMLEHIIQAARLRGMKRLSLETGVPEPFMPARRLYEKYGFQYCGPFGDYAPDPEWSVFMTLELT